MPRVGPPFLLPVLISVMVYHFLFLFPYSNRYDCHELD